MNLRYILFCLAFLSSVLLAQEQDIKIFKPAQVDSLDTAVPWYSYHNSTQSQHIIKFYTDGYRVSIGNVDSEAEALIIKQELELKLGINILYIYKNEDTYNLEVGDFLDNGSARLMMFQLFQMGYVKARVVEDKVLVF